MVLSIVSIQLILNSEITSLQILFLDVLDQSLETFLSIKFDRDEAKAEGPNPKARRKLRARTSSLDNNKNSSTRVSRERWKKALMPPPSAPTLKKSR